MDKDRIMSREVFVPDTSVKTIGYRQMKSWLPTAIYCLLSITLLSLSSCSYVDIKREVQIPEEVREIKADIPPSELKIPEFVPVTEEISPLKTKIVDIVARNTPLRDVLHVIAEATGINLVMEKEVNPEMPITLTLKNISAEDALTTIFSSVDYFYTIKDNMLFVKTVDTRIFELGHPAIIQNYTIDVGGDILGGAIGGMSGGTAGGTTGGMSSGMGSGSNIKGNVTQNVKSDGEAFDFWGAMEKSISSILGIAREQAIGQQNFSINRLTGTIVLTATKKNMNSVEHYLNTIKKVINRQVLVEAKVIEIELTESLKYGIDWNVVSRSLGDVFTFNTTNFSNIVPPTGPVFSMRATSGSDFNVLLKALRQQGEVRTLSNPRVNIMNGQTSLLSVGRNVNFISRVETITTTAAGSAPIVTFTVSTSSVLSGIIIGIVPYINENGEISLTITPIVSDLVKLEDKSIGSEDNNIRISLPTVDLRELSTTVKVRSGQMIVIGGLIQKKENLEKNKVPLLGDIPYFGELFTQRNKQEDRTELVLVLQPLIVSR